ncbi:type II secretion system F family protein [Maledivibacter halophilus]|uniref:Flp pilus assembly protein TadB n=1 Tax=Maledivibacter halophilus TaxID=36842 RepID=A0A1T5MF10_9FIRM|nr:hypothetical protein [Maledivibacter halophilus]SKC86836.1 hypothetical protein SAMN02194393_04581 [Maledivibacter halophilus]
MKVKIINTILIFLGCISLTIPLMDMEAIFMIKKPKKRIDDGRKARRKARREEIVKTKDSFYKRFKKAGKKITDELGFISYKTFIMFTIVGGFIGFISGQIFKNPVASIILALAGAILPYLILNLILRKRNIEKEEKLQIVLGDIQAELIEVKDFIKAIKNKLPAIEGVSKVLYKHFKWFVDMIELLTPDNNEEYMRELAERIDTHFFSEYMKLAIQYTKGDSSLIYTMESIPAEYAQHLSRNQKYKKIIEKHNKSFITTVLALPFAIVFLKLMSREYYMILVNHFVGKITLAVVLLAYLIGAIIFMKYNKDIKYQG